MNTIPKLPIHGLKLLLETVLILTIITHGIGSARADVVLSYSGSSLTELYCDKASFCTLSFDPISITVTLPIESISDLPQGISSFQNVSPVFSRKGYTAKEYQVIVGTQYININSAGQVVEWDLSGGTCTANSCFGWDMVGAELYLFHSALRDNSTADSLTVWREIAFEDSNGIHCCIGEVQSYSNLNSAGSWVASVPEPGRTTLTILGAATLGLVMLNLRRRLSSASRESECSVSACADNSNAEHSRSD